MLDLEVWSDRWMVALVVIALVVIAAGLSFSAIPGPVWHIPLIGDMVDFVVDPPAFFFKRIRKYGNVSRVHLFGRELILIGSPDLLKGGVV
ncbi:hypothetical protein FOA52_001374 [Chlamydomonas sp. UWO 241]|nr:hypothetical protein FOA52_001374 [Chlamydomonas sp. UWO 241]